MVIHVDIEVFQVGQNGRALDAVYGPEIVLYLVLVLADGRVVAVVIVAVLLGRRDRALHGHGCLGEML